MNNSYTLLVLADEGIINAESFGEWVTKGEAIETIKQLYPEAIAVLDSQTHRPLWATKWVSFS